MTELEKRFWLKGKGGLKPYLRMKDKGMPHGRINQIAWLLLNGSGCGFCKVCRDESCNIKDGEECTANIANYIKECVINEQWIPCSERLPEESLESVIGWDEYSERCCFVQYWGGRWILGDDTESVKIVAWQPIPEPYKAEI